jgi:uncharacterized membrane protein
VEAVVGAAVAVFRAGAAASVVAGPEGIGDMRAKEFVSKLQPDEIAAAIRAAEQKTSGEIRVFVSRKDIGNALSAAQAEFERLGMTRTRERNGVLIYVAPRAQKFAVIGDEAVHKRCGDEFWKELAAQMEEQFRKQEFTRGLVLAVNKAGELLAKEFPRRPDDRNELPDKVAGD